MTPHNVTQATGAHSGGSTESSARKEILTPEELVNHMEARGITFQLANKAEAAEYLSSNNNYFRLGAYRKNYDKHAGGPQDGKYVNLDFAMLVELAKLDMYLRDELLLLTLDIEHFAKLKLLSRIELEGEDGYSIVQDFARSYDYIKPDGQRSNRLAEELQSRTPSTYVSDLIAHYPFDRMPIWVFLELVSFGKFNHLYRFCADRFADRHMRREFYLLQTVKDLRNCCAHSNCLINNLRPDGSARQTDREVGNAVLRAGVARRTKSRKLSNERFRQVTTTLYVHSRICSTGVVQQRGIRLRAVVSRMERHSSWFAANETIASGFVYFKRLVCAWFPEAQ